MNKKELLKIEDLCVTFPSPKGRIRILDQISLSIKENEILGLVGESGSGKTVTALSILQLLEQSARCESGRISFRGENLLSKKPSEMTEIRGAQISMIFQSPRSALNPLKRIGKQVMRAFQLHQGLGRKASREQAIAMLEKVGFPDAVKRFKSYSHQLSTGMCQRVMIAMMITCQPALLLADEPTTALDVTIGTQIYDLLQELHRETGMSMLLITHDLGLVAENCDRVAVMHAGHIVEMGALNSIFEHAIHPYTIHLLRNIPRIDRDTTLPAVKRTVVEEMDYRTPGCRFARKCDFSIKSCREIKPELVEIASEHWVRCPVAVSPCVLDY